MCGIVGFWGTTDSPERVIRAMSHLIDHRGPDDHGEWLDIETGLAMGHRRLSIVDLSNAGHQPMRSRSGRFIVVYNGEIYNHLALRTELESTDPSTRWRGHSDTETLLAAIDAWGVVDTLNRLNGMFAFAVWDSLKQELTLARDRLGEKPLYYGTIGGTLFFGSELKALRAHPDWNPEIDRASLTLFFRHGYIPAPHSIFRGVKKLNAGSYIRIRRQNVFIEEQGRYWDLSKLAVNTAQPDEVDATALAAKLHSLLRESIEMRMMADVPLGAFLSGGYDSTLVAAIAQEQLSRPLRTFSIGFHEAGYDEAKHAKLVANHLGTEHVEMYVTPEDALDVVPHLPELWCEPFADSSQIPTYLLSKLTSKHVKVSLSGDGGDELFHGYERYFLTQRIWKRISHLPIWTRRSMAAIINSTPRFVFDVADQIIPGNRTHHLGDRLPKLSSIIAQADQRLLYRELISHWKDPASLVIGAEEPDTWFTSQLAEQPESLSDLMALFDAATYLPDDILVKVDRASMACSLETRVPLLDHRLVEHAWQIPISLKVGPDSGKQILKDLVHSYIPREIMDRPKMGFGVPIDDWLKGPLREWAETLLCEHRMRSEGYINPEPVQKMWREHLKGERRWHYYLWDVLMFESWLENFVSGNGVHGNYD